MANRCFTKQTRSCFMKSFTTRRYLNKRRADPDMRLEAVLGSACKRMKEELIDEGAAVDFAAEEKSLSPRGLLCSPPTSQRSSSAAPSTKGNTAAPTTDESRVSHPFEPPNDLPGLRLDKSLDEVKETKAGDRFLLNDAEQVAAFFRLVDSDNSTTTKSSTDRNVICTDVKRNPSFSCREHEEKPISDQELVDMLLSCEVEEFPSQFDTLYRRVLLNLPSLEEPSLTSASTPCSRCSSEQRTCHKCSNNDCNVDLGKEIASRLAGTA